jgi:enoyl-CoA hydratase/carnithine racemase
LDALALRDDDLDDGALVLVLEPDGSGAAEDRRTVARLASLPCIVVAVERGAGEQPAAADLVVEPDVAPLDHVFATVERNPLAATALALLLRGSAGRSVGDGLVAESTTYSVLQSGPEFAGWRVSRPRHPGRPPSADGPVRLRRAAGRLDLQLHRPEVRNAFDAAMRDAMLDGLAVAASDPTITEVHLSGSGPDFCSGGDLDEFGSFTDPAHAHAIRLRRSVGRAIHDQRAHVTAHLHGHCAGSGIELPAFAGRVEAAHDLAVSLPEVTMGLIPGAGGTVSLPARIGRHRTALLALSGVTIGAATASAWGLVDVLVDGPLDSEGRSPSTAPTDQPSTRAG